MFNTIFSWLFLIFIGISSVFLYLMALVVRLVTWLFDRRLVILHLYTCFWGSIYTWCVPFWKVRVTGREKMDLNKHYMIVSNHQSQLDILLAHRLFFPFRWISKAEVFRIPFIGWNMKLNKHIGIKRGDAQSREQMLKACEATLEEQVSLFFFPEGTRSETGELKPFKPGAFVLAHKMKTPILPVVINGTKDVLPKYSMTIRGHHEMSIQVLDEIPFNRFETLTIDETAHMVRQMITSHVKEHQKSGAIHA